MNTQHFNALIVDDEQDARDVIELLLNEMFPQIHIVAKADSVSTASHAVKEYCPDIVFLDIEMADGSGFDLLARFKHFPARVIFVTAYSDYAIKAIKASASDYILKPVSRGEFRDAVNKTIGKLEKENFETLVVSQTQQRSQVKKIGIPNLTGFSFVDTNTIIRCEADGHYTSVFFANKPKAYVSKTLSHFEKELLPFGFFRVHHKHLVNLDFISSYSKGKGGGYITMSDGAELEVSIRKKAELLKVIA